MKVKLSPPQILVIGFLSVILSALFTPLGKFAISFTMFLGRLGPLTLAIAITRKADERKPYCHKKKDYDG